MAVRDNDHVGEQFLWTGIDYLGEANRWPNRGSGAGAADPTAARCERFARARAKHLPPGFRLVDAQGVRVPDAEPELTFTTDGPAKIIGIENGDLNDPATGKDGVRKAYHGRGLAIVQSTHQAGKVQVRARATGLNETGVEIEIRP